MTNQEKKEWLSQYKRLNARIDRLRAEESAWRDRATRGTVAGMPSGSGVSDQVGGAVAKIADLRAEINGEIERLAALRREIQRVIRAVPDDTLRELLAYRYIEGWTFERIAVEMHYCYMQICRLHGKALSIVML